MLSHLFKNFTVDWPNDDPIPWLTDLAMDLLTHSKLWVSVYKQVSLSFLGETECLECILNTSTLVYKCVCYPIREPRDFASWWSWMFSSNFHSHGCVSSIFSTYGHAVPFLKNYLPLYEPKSLHICHFHSVTLCAIFRAMYQVCSFSHDKFQMFKDSFYVYSFR